MVAHGQEIKLEGSQRSHYDKEKQVVSEKS